MRISINGRKIRVVAKLQLDVFTNRALKQRAHVREHFIESDAAEVRHAVATEGDQLMRQLPGALGGPRHLLQRVVHRWCQMRLGPQKPGMSMNDRDDVAEIVRDTGG